MTQLPLFPMPGKSYPTRRNAGLPLRDRPAYRVMAGSAACNTAELLATVISGPQSLETATRLLSRFGSLHNVARASVADLVQVQGIGNSAAARLLAATEISRRLLAPEDQRQQISSPADAAAIFQPLLMHRDQEYLYVLLLDTRNRVMGTPHEVYHGSLNTSLIRVAEIFREAIRANAAAIIVAHNHPSGEPEPSPEDVMVTREIVQAGKLLDVELLDHLVIGQGRWVSLREKGLGWDT